MIEGAQAPEECEVCGWPLAGQGEHVSRAPTGVGMSAVHVCRLCWAIGTARFAHYPDRYDAVAGLVIGAVCYVGNSALAGSLRSLATVAGIAARVERELQAHREVSLWGPTAMAEQGPILGVECACGWYGSAARPGSHEYVLGADEVATLRALRALHARHVADVIVTDLARAIVQGL